MVYLLAIGALLLSLPVAAEIPWFDGGHTKARVLGANYPDDSVFQEPAGEWASDQGADLRLKFAADRERVSLNVDYQLQAQFGDSLDFPGESQGLFLTTPAVPDDDRRWWDLTHSISDNDSRAVVQRLDRLHLDYRGERAVVRFGRQAVTWGNGLIYTPMDFFNPFDPAAVDTEYKLGDDMLYGQYLLDSGSDWQFVSVQRRDEDGDVDSTVSSTALKFHGFGVDREFDLLVAEHYDQWVVGAGGLVNIGEAVLRGDITLTDARDGWETSLVANWSWSWVWGGHNVSAVAEYFYNGFGLKESDYSPEDLREDRDLVERLARGELFTIGRHYLAGSLLVEVTPLLNVTPNLFLNADDGSALAQLVLQWDPAQDWQLLGSVAVPLGSSNTEYGGLETGVDDTTLEVGPSLFLQLGWYF
jgi:hypothetical protein